MGQTCTAEQYYASKRGTHVLRSSIEKGNRVVRCPKAVNGARRQGLRTRNERAAYNVGTCRVLGGSVDFRVKMSNVSQFF